MARKTPDPETVAGVTLERAIRLYRLLKQVGTGPTTRTALIRKLRLGIRGFYRDLEVLRAAGIVISLAKGKYALDEPLLPSLEKLPFPDPCLTLGEARRLSRGRTLAHQKIKAQLRLLER